MGWSLRVKKQVGSGLVDLRKDSNSGSTVQCTVNLNEPVKLIPEGPKFVLNWVGLVLMVENASQFELGCLGTFGSTRPTNFAISSAMSQPSTNSWRKI